MASKIEEGEISVAEGRPDLKIEEPPKYSVFLHNDDYTTMEFVVEILQQLFHRTHDEAVQIMLRIHHEGKGVAGVYSFEIAETKVMQATERAQSKGFPLKCTLEKV